MSLAAARPTYDELLEEVTYLRSLVAESATSEDIASWRAEWGLSVTEGRVLAALRRRRGYVARWAVLEEVWPAGRVTLNNLAVVVSNIRRKMGRGVVETEHSIGVRLSDAGREMIKAVGRKDAEDDMGELKRWHTKSTGDEFRHLILAYLDDGTPRGGLEIANALEISPGSVYRHLDGLMTLGRVELASHRPTKWRRRVRPR